MLRSRLVKIAPEDEEALEGLLWLHEEGLPQLIEEAAQGMVAEGWTQADLARLLGVTPQAIHKRWFAPVA
jgi:hypothetical protein